jgi:hypothetical protein
MRQELTRLGVQETRTPEAVDAVLGPHGQPVFMLPRHQIEQRDATEIAKALTEAFDQFCVQQP